MLEKQALVLLVQLIVMQSHFYLTGYAEKRKYMYAADGAAEHVNEPEYCSVDFLLFLYGRVFRNR